MILSLVEIRDTRKFRMFWLCSHIAIADFIRTELVWRENGRALAEEWKTAERDRSRANQAKNRRKMERVTEKWERAKEREGKKIGKNVQIFKRTWHKMPKHGCGYLFNLIHFGYLEREMYALYYIVSILCCISGMILGDFFGFYWYGNSGFSSEMCFQCHLLLLKSNRNADKCSWLIQ